MKVIFGYLPTFEGSRHSDKKCIKSIFISAFYLSSLILISKFPRENLPVTPSARHKAAISIRIPLLLRFAESY